MNQNDLRRSFVNNIKPPFLIYPQIAETNFKEGLQQNSRQFGHYSTSIKVKYQNYCHHLFATTINQWGKTGKQMNQDYLFFSQTHFYVMHFPRFSCDTLSRDVYHQRLDPTRQKLLCSEHCSKITSCVCTRPFMPCHQKVFVVATENCFVCLLCCSLTNFQRSNQYCLKILYLSNLHPFSIQMEGGEKHSCG